MVHADAIAIAEDGVVEAGVALPRPVVHDGDVARLRPVQAQLDAVGVLDEVVVEEKLAARADVDGHGFPFKVGES